MSFLIYAAVIIVAAASAMFGLDLLTTPLPQKPATQVTSTATPSRLVQREADRRQEAEAATRTDDRALTPVFPTSTSGAKEVRMVYPPTNETAVAANTDDKHPAPQSKPAEIASAEVQPVNTQAAAPEKSEAKAEVKTETPAALPVTQQSANHCDVSACAAAYSSFRVSDCTYQPYGGARRVCEKGADGAQRADNAPRSKPTEARIDRSSRSEAELRAVEKRVRELTSARGDVDDDIDDAPVRRRVIVIERGYGGGFGRW